MRLFHNVIPLLIVNGFSAFAAAEPAATTMKAIVIHSFGGPEMLKYEETPKPAPATDQVLIRVIAASVNPVDVAIREGRFGGGSSPLIPGMDVAGVVEKAGVKTSKFKKGDAVYAYLSFQEQGGYAQFAVAKEDEVALKPKGIDFVGAAAVPLAATTAWQALVEKAQLGAGQTVLIHGGTGGVGSFAVQIAKARGAKVIATASTANQDLLKQLGVDQPIDYETTNFQEVVKDVDVVLNAVRGDTLARSYDVVKPGGFLVSITGAPDARELEKHAIRGTGMTAHPDREVLEELSKLIEAGKIKPIVSTILPLSEAASAQEQVSTAHTRGKIVLKVSDEPKS